MAGVSVSKTTILGRSAFSLENDVLRVTVTAYGGHLAEMLHKSSRVSPLWRPPWISIDPPMWTAPCEDLYGPAPVGRMLASVAGHFLCLGTFGMPSDEEQATGAVCHGEALLALCAVTEQDSGLTCTWNLPALCLRVTRHLTLAPGSSVLAISETVENEAIYDCPIAWTQHVTLGPPFLRREDTCFRFPSTRSITPDGQEFTVDGIQRFGPAGVSGGFLTHPMDSARQNAYFVAHSPALQLAHGYIWQRSEFPWLGVWTECLSLQDPPWDGKGFALGMEFGVSPFPESRRAMLSRGRLSGLSCGKWIPAQTAVTVHYCAFVSESTALPEELIWDGRSTVQLRYAN